MKRFVGLTLVFSGTILGIFVINLLLYAYNPEYHRALEAAVVGDSNIPVISADGSVTANSLMATGIETKTSETVFVDIEDQDDSVNAVPLAASYGKETVTSQVQDDDTDDVKKAAIVDKEYHEDCGTGEGYWIIRYSDGTVEVE